MAHQEQKWQLADYRPPWGSVVYVDFFRVKELMEKFPLRAGELFPFRGADNPSKFARPCIVLCNFDRQCINGESTQFVVLLPLTSQHRAHYVMTLTPTTFNCKGDAAREKLSHKPSYIKAFTPAVFQNDRIYGLAILPRPSTEFRDGKLSSAGWDDLRRHINEWEHSDIAKYIKTALSSQNGDDARSHTSGYPRVQQQTPLARASSVDSGQQSFLLLDFQSRTQFPDLAYPQEKVAREVGAPNQGTTYSLAAQGSTERDAEEEAFPKLCPAPRVEQPAHASSVYCGHPRVSVDCGRIQLVALEQGHPREKCAWNQVFPMPNGTLKTKSSPEHHTSPPSSSLHQNITICTVLRKRAARKPRP